MGKSIVRDLHPLFTSIFDHCSYIIVGLRLILVLAFQIKIFYI